MSKRGCLVIHGFAGGRYEVEPLVNFLAENGFETESVKLAGHEEGRKTLSRSSHRDWLRSCQEGYDLLKQKCDKIIILGFSMGGLLAVNLLQKNKADAVIMMAAPVYIWDFGVIVRNIVRDIVNGRQESIGRYIESISKSPLSACLNFMILKRKTKPLFQKVDIPCMVVQGRNDDTTIWKSADYIYSKVSSKKKVIKFYDNAPHMICNYADSMKVFQDILEFINGI